MKNFLLTLLTGLFLSLSVFAQQYTLLVSGTVMTVSANTTVPVPDQAVNVMIDSTSNGFTYQNIVFTNESGYYEDIVVIPEFSGYGYIIVSTLDSCLGQMVYQSQFFAAGATITNMDFNLCNYTPPTCQAQFYTYQSGPADPLTFTFVNQSIGNFTQVTWNFGDSTFSSETNPVHTFPGEGSFYVCLTISDGAECSSTTCQMVVTGANYNGCENYFLYNYDEPATLTFEGFLESGLYAQYYWWDFGDGTSGEGQTITHTFPTGQGNSGVYLVGLSTIVMDSMGDSCFYTSYQPVEVSNGQGCNAYFTYYSDSMNVETVYFQDMSYNANGSSPASWLWEFGDGTSSNLQNPVHNYADTGFYFVCLTIADSTGLCSDTYCENVYTGYTPPPPQGCESYISYNNINGLTVDFQGYTNSQFPTLYTWEFGDGITGSGQFVTHTYAAPDNYTITLQTVDSTGCSFISVAEVWLDTLNQGCNTSFSYLQDDSLTFTFTGYAYFNNGMTYPDSSTVYNWDFGDGTTGYGETVTHTFQQNPAGGSTVCLTTTIILDAGYCTSTYCETVTFEIPSLFIYGGVYLGNNQLADQAEVHLMAMDTTQQGVVEIQSTLTDAGGSFSFPDITQCNSCIYYVQAELTPGSVYYGQFIPTYHTSAYNWEFADPVLLPMEWAADIYMIPGDSVYSGGGAITGIVSDLGTRGTMSDVEIILMDADKNLLTYLRSDDQGQFRFDGLAFGTYVIHAELMAIHTVEAEVTISADKPESIVEVQVIGGNASIVFGIHEQPANLDMVSEVYPNPVNASAKIDITVKKPVNAEISIFNQTGQLMNTHGISLDSGTQSINLNSGSLPVGLYLVRVTTAQGELISRKFMKAQ